jgi:hypothetical protein
MVTAGARGDEAKLHAADLESFARSRAIGGA